MAVLSATTQFNAGCKTLPSISISKSEGTRILKLVFCRTPTDKLFALLKKTSSKRSAVRNSELDNKNNNQKKNQQRLFESSGSFLKTVLNSDIFDIKPSVSNSDGFVTHFKFIKNSKLSQTQQTGHNWLQVAVFAQWWLISDIIDTCEQILVIVCPEQRYFFMSTVPRILPRARAADSTALRRNAAHATDWWPAVAMTYAGAKTSANEPSA